MDAERLLARGRINLMFDYPFLGCLAMNLELVEDKLLNPPTMATDGTHLYYSPEFVLGLTEKQMMGVLAHEIYHIILWHATRECGRSHDRWNNAADYACNNLVFKELDSKTGSEAFELPFGILYEPNFGDNSAEWIYERIPDPPPHHGSGGGKDGGQNTGFDSHEKWSDWGKDFQGEEDTQDIETLWRERIAQAANQARMRGKLPGHLAELVEDTLQPKLDWKTILQDFVVSTVKSNYRYMPPNKKHLWRGIYLPSLYGEEISIAYACDSSGSISPDEAREQLAEIKGICDMFEGYTIYGFICDTNIHQRFVIQPFEPMPELRFRGGGTSFVEPIEEAAKLPISCLIYATDLYGTFPPAPRFPVIWLAFTDHTPPFGRVIRMPEHSPIRK